MKRLAILVIALAVIILSVYTFVLNAGQGGKEHVVIIPSGAFIPPEGWKKGERVYDDRYFSPNTLEINVGDYVRWINRDSVTHTVTSEKTPVGGSGFDSVLSPGKSFRTRFTKAGEYDYYCTIHPWQGGRVIVS
ncbi:MAG: cupredoxin domain-containing protein [Aigarchaeota archaeon]|nr:cupredoxin domain-containing protein [Candidatus Pelearchaeum maunauluense]